MRGRLTDESWVIVGVDQFRRPGPGMGQVPGFVAKTTQPPDAKRGPRWLPLEGLKGVLIRRDARASSNPPPAGSHALECRSSPAEAVGRGS